MRNFRPSKPDQGGSPFSLRDSDDAPLKKPQLVGSESIPPLSATPGSLPIALHRRKKRTISLNMPGHSRRPKYGSRRMAGPGALFVPGASGRRSALGSLV